MIQRQCFRQPCNSVLLFSESGQLDITALSFSETALEIGRFAASAHKSAIDASFLKGSLSDETIHILHKSILVNPSL